MQDTGYKIQDAGCRMQDAGPVCAFSKDRYQVPDSVAGLRSSALGLDKGGGKVVPPSPLIPPWPRAGYRGPSRGTDYLAPGTWYPAPEPVRRRGPNTEHRRPSPDPGKRAHRVCIMHTSWVVFRRQMTGTGYRIRCPAFSSRSSAWRKDAGRSHLPCPSSLHGRGPSPTRIPGFAS